MKLKGVFESFFHDLQQLFGGCCIGSSLTKLFDSLSLNGDSATPLGDMSLGQRKASSLVIFVVHFRLLSNCPLVSTNRWQFVNLTL
ncbi:hypothetical protein BURK_019405 [Burkholderia sp. SJ98]|nr:hypothetical protein BURK_019405 [Burkholderia sp. SJ98]